MDYIGLHRAPRSRTEKVADFGRDILSHLNHDALVVVLGSVTLASFRIASPATTELPLPPVAERPNPQTAMHVKRIQTALDRFLAANAATFQPNVICEPDREVRTCARYPGKSETADLSISYQNRSIDSTASDWRMVELDMRKPNCVVTIIPTDAAGFELNQYDADGTIQETTLGNYLSAKGYAKLEDTVVNCIDAESLQLESASNTYIRD